MSDTKQDQKECGTCKFIIKNNGVNYCDNSDSEYYQNNVDYDDGCEHCQRRK